MRSSFNKLIIVLSISVITACSNNTNKSYTIEATGNGTSVFPIATPLQVSYEDEVKLLRLNQSIADTTKNDDKERAVLLYQRGLVYDRIGMTAHSRLNFNQALNLDPTFADAYNSLGVYLLMGGAYDEAFEAFDSAIELSDKADYSYLHRAIGLALVGRTTSAQEDIERFYELDKNDPYRVLWRYKINYQIDPKLAISQIRTTRPVEGDRRFAWALVGVINEQITEERFFDNIANGVKTNEQLAQRLCEAYYYLAHWHINNNNLSKGIYYLKLSIAANIKDFIEYKYAFLDLKTIQNKLKNSIAKVK